MLDVISPFFLEIITHDNLRGLRQTLYNYVLWIVGINVTTVLTGRISMLLYSIWFDSGNLKLSCVKLREKEMARWKPNSD